MMGGGVGWGCTSMRFPLRPRRIGIETGKGGKGLPAYKVSAKITLKIFCSKTVFKPTPSASLFAPVFFYSPLFYR